MKTKRDNFPKAVLDRMYENDEGYQFTFREWLQTNFYEKDVLHVSANDVRSVVDLEVGESVTIWITQIKRLT